LVRLPLNFLLEISAGLPSNDGEFYSYVTNSPFLETKAILGDDGGKGES